SEEQMCRVKANGEFGIEMNPAGKPVPCGRPVIADARMMPYESLRTTSGTMVKADGAGHGDDHFFPGPCDIAWDLAGAIVEWRMPPASADSFLREYQHRSGDDARARLPFWMAAYLAFRAGWCMLAAQAMSGTEDAPRLERT